MIFNSKDITEKENAINYFQKLIENKKIIEIKSKREKDIRSLGSNALYWLWLGFLGDKSGNDFKDLHKYYKNEFIGITTREVLGKMIIIPPTTTDKDPKEFSYYMKQVKSHAYHFFNEVLPEPSDLNFNNFYETYKHTIYAK